MEIELISFGKVSEIIKNQKIEFSGTCDTDGVKSYLEKSYPRLKNINYKLALNNKFLQENSQIADNDIIAIMPPFSGG